MRAPEIDVIKQTLRGPGSAEEKAQMLAALRKRTDASLRMDEFFIGQAMRVEHDMSRIQIEHQRLRDLLDQMTRPPLIPATYLRAVGNGLMVLLAGGGRRIVNCAEDFDASALRPGDDVLLSADLSLLVRASGIKQNTGEVAIFDRTVGDRLVLQHRGDEFVVQAVGPLLADLDSLVSGDPVRFDRSAMLAYERLPRSSHEHFFVTDPPKATFDDIGGLDKQIEELKSLVTLRFFHPDKAAGYGLMATGGLLLEGPPGTGKTMLAGALAHWVGEISSGGAKWIAVQPGEFRNEFYGVTERRFRECFAAARAAGDRDRRYPVICFFDELDAIGATRGKYASHVDDRVMQAFAAELDGISGNGNILCVAATNRADCLDPAIQRRFGNKRIQVPRPNMQAAASILHKHIAAGCPVYCNGFGTPEHARAYVIEAAVSRLYSPNGEPALCKTVFRDATVREVRAADLISGANLANIARAAREKACWREVRGGAQGLRTEDVFSAIDVEIENLARVLTPANVRDYVLGLPDDLDVVRIERPRGNRRHSMHKYLATA